MMEISADNVREAFELDADQGVLVWRHNRTIAGHPVNGKRAGRKDEFRWTIRWEGRNWYRYRLIFLYVHGWMPKSIDHKDGNSLNDRPENLRDGIGQKHQSQNRRRRRRIYDLPKGVFLQTNRSTTPFRARITVNGNNKYLGSFRTAKEAHEAYSRAAKEHFGEFARVD